MFNDKYGLTAAVLQGRKTMTRRIVGKRMTEDDIRAYLKGYTELANKCAQYKIGEVVAVAQPYKDIGKKFLQKQCRANEEPLSYRVNEAGWNNKMFGAAYYLPHQIRITGIKVERLQDISEEDCLKEGVKKNQNNCTLVYHGRYNDGFYHYPTARDAFAALIDGVSGNGTWERNPWVFAYSFKFVK